MKEKSQKIIRSRLCPDGTPEAMIDVVRKLFKQGYRQCKYELTGELDPVGTIYPFDKVTPLYSKNGQECAMCPDVRVDSEENPKLRELNVISRYLACKSRREYIQVFLETDLAYPIAPPEGPELFPPEYYQKIKEKVGKLYDHPHLRIGEVLIRLNEEAICREILKNAPPNLFNDQEWEDFFSVVYLNSHESFSFPLSDEKLFMMERLSKDSKYIQKTFKESHLIFLTGLKKVDLLRNYHRMAQLGLTLFEKAKKAEWWNF